MDNLEIARILKEIGEYLAMEEKNSFFRARAYEKAAEAVASLKESLSEIYKKGGLKTLEEISGVGVSIAEKIEELLKTGHSKHHEELKKKVPVDLSSFKGIEGLGPKSILKLYQKLKIKNLADL